jgi:hypothetical protein
MCKEDKLCSFESSNYITVLIHTAKPWTMMKAYISRLMPTIIRFVHRTEERYVCLKCILFPH